MFNRSEIMKEAWRLWNSQFKGRLWLVGSFDRKRFAWNLKQAWYTARKTLLTAKERRVDAIEAKIDALKYKSFQVNVEPIRRRLRRRSRGRFGLGRSMSPSLHRRGERLASESGEA